MWHVNVLETECETADICIFLTACHACAIGIQHAL